MFAGENKTQEIDAINTALSDHDESKTHSRHFSPDDCENMGLKIFRMEDDEKLQDLILTVHHAYMHTFTQTKAVKIVENQNGIALVLFKAPEG